MTTTRNPRRKVQKIKVRRKITSRNQTKQVRQNTSNVNKLMRKTLPICRYYLNDTGVIASKTHVKLLTQPSNFEPCFRTFDVPNEDTPRSYSLQHLALKWCVQVESNTSGNTWCQVFVVSLKPRTARKVLERTTNLSNLTAEVDYTDTDMGSSALAAQGEGFFYLNPALYTTHYRSGVRRIGESTMGAGTAVTNIRDSTTRGRASIKFQREIKADEYHPNGFRNIDAAHLEPRNHLYFILMSNASETSEVFLTTNVLITGRQATSQ